MDESGKVEMDSVENTISENSVVVNSDIVLV
jgi:hypothetical protein